MDKLPGFKPVTALALGLVVFGCGLFVAGFCVGIVTLALGSGSAGGFLMIAGVGFGVQLILLGCLVGAVSLGTHWALNRFRACPVWHAL